MKRNKNKWHKREYCKICKGYRTRGGLRFKLFGLIPIKLTEWKHECRCFEYKGKTELDKEKCEEVIRKQENNNGNENK